MPYVPEHFPAARAIESLLIDRSGNLLIHPTDFYNDLDPEALRVFCHYAARYLLPTRELVKEIKFLIGEKTALEIGAGAGDLGRALGIRMTDSFLQQTPEVAALYAASGQPVIRYGEDVERMAAARAIDTYKPQVVVAAWVTQYISPDLPPPPGGGNVWGVNEEALLENVDRYIFIGSVGIHQHKFIHKIPKTYEKFSSSIRSRRHDNVIWVWDRPALTAYR